MTDHVVSWFFSDSPGEESLYPQVRGTSSSPAFQDVYLRCLAVSMASSVAVNAQSSHTVVVNTFRPFETAVGRAVRGMLKDLDVTIVQTKFSRRPPDGWHHAWVNQFFLLDVIACATTQLRAEDALLVLDSDVVWLRPGDALFADVRRDGGATYVLDYPPDHPINGLSRKDLAHLYADIDGVDLDDEAVDYCGGEFVALSAATAARTVEVVDELLRINISRHSRGLSKSNEEAHLLSHAYRRLGLPMGVGNAHVKRIWTGPRAPNNGDPSDLGLTIWHVPAEKRTGLRVLYERLRKSDVDDASMWTPGQLGRVLGVPRSSARKNLSDVLRLTSARLSAR